MTKTKGKTNLFDPALFGEELRNARRQAGYTNSQKFSAAIESKTGVFIDKDTIMRYERGNREPDITKLLAIAVTLYERDWPHEMLKLITNSMPDNGISVYMSLTHLSNEIAGARARLEVIESRKIAAVSDVFEIPYAQAKRMLTLADGDLDVLTSSFDEFCDYLTNWTKGTTRERSTTIEKAFHDHSNGSNIAFTDAFSNWMARNQQSTDPTKPAQ